MEDWTFMMLTEDFFYNYLYVIATSASLTLAIAATIIHYRISVQLRHEISHLCKTVEILIRDVEHLKQVLASEHGRHDISQNPVTHQTETATGSDAHLYEGTSPEGELGHEESSTPPINPAVGSARPRRPLDLISHEPSSNPSTRLTKDVDVSAMSVTMAPGPSLAGTTIAALIAASAYNVAAAIEVKNFTRWRLVNPKTFLHSGQISKSAQRVDPGFKEVMFMHKIGHTASGTHGTVSWEVGDDLVIVMWSVPFDQNIYANWLGISCRPRTSSLLHTKDVFNTMYYGKVSWSRRQEYYGATSTLRGPDLCDKLYVTGKMGTSHKPEIQISVIPHRTGDLAPRLTDMLKD